MSSDPEYDARQAADYAELDKQVGVPDYEFTCMAGHDPPHPTTMKKNGEGDYTRVGWGECDWQGVKVIELPRIP